MSAKWRLAVAVLAVIAGTGCACSRCTSRGDDAGVRQRAPLVRSLAEARAALGQRVRVEGTVAREKLGDSVDVGGLVFICLDYRFEDSLLGRTVEVEGVLDETRDFEAVRGPRGEVSQGTESEAPLLVLRGCKSPGDRAQKGGR